MTTQLTSFMIDGVEFYTLEGCYYQKSNKGFNRLSENVYKYYEQIFWENYIR